MKKFLCLSLAVLILLSTLAFAETRTIDLDTMTLDELNALASEVQAAIVNKSVENIDGYIVLTDYSEYARNPNAHVGEMIRFNGKVVQVVEGNGQNIYRIAFNSDSDNIFYVTLTTSNNAQHILEDDKVTVFGQFNGLYTYTSTFGGEITVP